jgi:hypothetical protein
MAKINDSGQWLRSALQHAPTDWTPQCPDPATVLDWLEQGDAHPDALQLLDHLSSCAHCRQQRVALREIRRLSAETAQATAKIETAAIPGLRSKVKRWIRGLIAEGLIPPVTHVRASLDRLQALALSPSRAVTNSHEVPTRLRPSATAVRSGRPTLSWLPVQPNSNHEVILLQVVGDGFRLAGEGRVGSESQFTLPEGLTLKPGSYLWQVFELVGDTRIPSAMVGFVVLNESSRSAIATLEPELASAPLARIGLYETYGLYEEALLVTETLILQHTDDKTVQVIHKKLIEHLSVRSITS